MFNTIQANLPILYFLAVAHCIMGLLAAGVAQRKGYHQGFWLIWGLIGGTVAFVTASRLKPKTDIF
ncbi:hypothetical protein [Laspinema olomoucense]|uniref:Uncharacterized protein n=1 Tax=Laspinema olomoucense D3b TaxID=2953688 RepID=A0ABT2N3D8_9CYAN|nr:MULTISPECIES: hypothetical protein [unclassified Laspinema]MCT7971715.1 hypothetical protein [Laspinema sp. D3d]MCT7977203.1 hypothetical protein [Laspinema sp. D3b]MCT7987953.1 hypothetical protein [Laspinema sp. D3a]MCT7992973.1 hypothetical protein [Laspinema sp. D3c]